MSETKVDLTNGGNCVVIHGATGFVKEYATNPQVTFINAKDRIEGISSRMPFDVKVIIITDGIENLNYAWAMSYCRTNRTPYLVRKSNQAVYETLKSFFVNGNGTAVKPTTDEVIEHRQRNRYQQFESDIDWTISNAENARIIHRKCVAIGINTTHSALAQWLTGLRKKQSGVTAVPRSARSKLDVSVEIFDKMIEDLTGMRDFLIQTVEENRLLKTKYDRLKKAMED